MPSEEVIELSVEETNKLRAELGLAPLRVDGDHSKNNIPEENVPPPPTKANQDDNEVLELSVDETNKLREKLGLPPLRGGSSKAIERVDLKAQQEAEKEAEEAEKAKLEAEYKKGFAKTFTEKSLGADESNDVTSWAESLRKSKAAAEEPKKKKKKKDKKTKNSSEYDEKDLKGMNVSHAMSELEAGSTTVMTLTDAPILQTKDDNPYLTAGLNEDADHPQLENVNLAEASKQADGLKKKRQLEMGMGRAGGYAGYDDDEFLELGGSGVPSRAARGTMAAADPKDPTKKPRKGFQIGDAELINGAANKGSDLFAMENGNAISLEPMQADVQASDFMTEQEDLEVRGKDRKKKKKEKFDKKKKKKDKKKHRRRQVEDDDESEDEGLQPTKSGKSLLDELEETAEDSARADKKSRKRNRSEEDSDSVKKEGEEPALVPSADNLDKPDPKETKKEDKRAKYDAIMDKGNARTREAFASKEKKAEADMLDEEPDDAFLNAALAKARRLKKLRGMSSARGAEAVVEAVQSMPDAAPSSADATSSGGVEFSIDETREFTRALKAKADIQNRQQKKAASKKDNPAVNTTTTVAAPIKQEEVESPSKMEVETVKEEETEDVDMAELAKEIKEDGNDAPYLEGGTGSTVSVGRGMAGMLNLLKQTGELSRKNAGKEEMRGRAKDERTYEDYEALDLDKVVKIDRRFASDKDREIASREVKLEYRDKHGRLLTRKEAFRDLCYQFHGHGSSKRKEEKKQKQMAREQAEARFASQQVLGSDGGPGTLGALKATQKATGKAFVVHKT